MNTFNRYLFYIYLVAMIPHLFYLTAWANCIALIVSFWAYFIYSRDWQKPHALLISAFAVLSPLLVYIDFKTLLGPDAATTLLVILGSLKLHEIKSKRDSLIFLFFLLLLTMYALLFSQSILMTAYMMTMVFLVALGFLALHAPNKKLLFPKSTRTNLALDFALCLPIFLLFFFMFPRFQTPWGRMLVPPKSVIGFSDNFNPGAFASLAQSEETAFTVDFLDNSRPPLSQLYWRGSVLEGTDGWRWHKLKDITNTVKIALPTETQRASDTFIRYRLSLEAKFKSTIFVLDAPIEAKVHSSFNTNPILEKSNHIFESQWPNISRVVYFGVSDVQNRKKLLPEMSNEAVFLMLPDSISDEVKQLATKFSKNALNRIEIANRVFTYFREQDFKYSLNVPETQSVDEFLFKNKYGFCEHFASAFGVLMRASGVPSRVVAGFLGGEYNDFSDHLLVKDKQAHAWNEILLEDGSWLRIDPTESVNYLRINSGTVDSIIDSSNLLRIAWLRSIMLAQAIDNRYSSFLLNYSYDEQLKLFELDQLAKIKKWHWILAVIALACLLAYLLYVVLPTRANPADPLFGFYQALIAKLQNYGFKLDSTIGPLALAKLIKEDERTNASESNRKRIDHPRAVKSIELFCELRYGPKMPRDKKALKESIRMLKRIIDTL